MFSIFMTSSCRCLAARRASDRAAQAEALRDRQLRERTATLTPALAANAAELDALYAATVG